VLVGVFFFIFTIVQNACPVTVVSLLGLKFRSGSTVLHWEQERPADDEARKSTEVWRAP
jgi:hypothetical protein